MLALDNASGNPRRVSSRRVSSRLGKTVSVANGDDEGGKADLHRAPSNTKGFL